MTHTPLPTILIQHPEIYFALNVISGPSLAHLISQKLDSIEDKLAAPWGAVGVFLLKEIIEALATNEVSPHDVMQFLTQLTGILGFIICQALSYKHILDSTEPVKDD